MARTSEARGNVKYWWKIIKNGCHLLVAKRVLAFIAC
jgi:hypothetical protein